MGTTNADSTIKAEELGLTLEAVSNLNHFLVAERAQTSATFLSKWLDIGDICLRIKALKAEGKFSDLVNGFFGTVLSNDERQYSMKLFDNKKDVEKWYREKGCMKYNPRTIWTAFQADVNPTVKKKATKKTDGDGDGDNGPELRKERNATDVLKAYTDFKKIFDNASENGNMKSEDFDALIGNLKATLEEVTQMAEFEANALSTEKKETTKTAKTKAKKVA